MANANVNQPNAEQEITRQYEGALENLESTYQDSVIHSLNQATEIQDAQRRKAAVVVNSRRGSLVLMPVQESRRLGAIYSEHDCRICGGFDGPLYLVIGRNVSSKQIQEFAVREEIDPKVLIKFRDSVGLPKLSDLPSCNPNIAVVAKDDFSEVDLQTLIVLFKKAKMHLLVFPQRSQLDAWDYGCVGATRAQVLANGAKNEALCYG